MNGSPRVYQVIVLLFFVPVDSRFQSGIVEQDVSQPSVTAWSARDCTIPLAAGAHSSICLAIPRRRGDVLTLARSELCSSLLPLLELSGCGTPNCHIPRSAFASSPQTNACLAAGVLALSGFHLPPFG